MLNNSLELVIRKAVLTDAQVLAQIGADTFYETFSPYNSSEDMAAYIAKAYAPEVINANLNNSDITYYLCLDDGEVIGYSKLIGGAGFEGLTGRNIELEKIYVLSKHHGTPAGRLLMESAITFATSSGFDHVFLGVWQENRRAVRFYEKNGFEVFATRSFQLGSRICDDYMMKRKL